MTNNQNWHKAYDCELNYTKAPWIADARHVVSQLWCKPDTSHLVMEPALCEHIVQLIAGLKIEIAVAKAENFSAVLNSAESKEPLEIKMTNNKNWPDRVYLETWNSNIGVPHFSCGGSKSDPDCMEYLSADKVREIQLATIKATLEKVATNENLHLGDLQSYWLLKTDPQSIIEQVKI